MNQSGILASAISEKSPLMTAWGFGKTPRSQSELFSKTWPQNKTKRIKSYASLLLSLEQILWVQQNYFDLTDKFKLYFIIKYSPIAT